MLTATVEPSHSQEHPEEAPLRTHIAGLEQHVPVLDGRHVPYVSYVDSVNRVNLGSVQPIHRLARKIHAAGGKILVDAAQPAPHRAVAT